MPRAAKQKTVTIIGGGPAGLIAADILSTASLKVVLYDRMPSLGRKFLLAGRGGLNLTHSESMDILLQRYGPAADWLAPMIARFSPDDLRRFAHELGERTFTGSSGRVFPKSFKTSPLLRAWLRRLAAQNVETHLRHRFTGFAEDGGAMFETDSQQIRTIYADATILAMGGASWPKLGSDGRWTDALTHAQSPIAPLRPANCGFLVNWPQHLATRFAGTALKSIAIEFNDRRLEGECIITETGLEGGVIYALSTQLREAIDTGGSATLLLDLKPGANSDQLATRLAAVPRKQTLSNRLRKAARLSPAAIALLRLQQPADDPQELARLIKYCPVRLTGMQPIARAISSAGGIARDALDEHLMLKAMPGVFAAGEMLDWEAPTGGYLLQACFSTGVAAAHGVQNWLKI